MDEIWKCIVHKHATEIYCSTCKSYLCLECLSSHNSSCSSPEYVHVFKRAEKIIIPKIDNLSKSISSDTEITKEITSLVRELNSTVPKLKKTVREHDEIVKLLKELTGRMKGYMGTAKFQHIADQMRISLTHDKKKLESVLKKEDDKQVVALTKKILSLEESKKNENSEKELIPKIKKDIKRLDYLKTYDAIINDLQFLAARCQRLKLCNYIIGWTLDRKYLTRKMTLSNDGLTYGNSASDGYPGIIGTIPFDSGICLFKVTPSGLNCAGKEGFGIIEYDKYLEKVKKDPTTPAVHDDMIGFFYQNLEKRMKAIKKAVMTMNSPYIVKVDLNNYVMSIKGNNTHLETELKPGVLYVPCFSCGCTDNKFVIEVLDSETDDKI